MGEERKRKGSRSRAWSDVPQELLELIMRNLGYMDQVRFRSVCGKWRSMYRVLCSKQQYQLPMYMIWKQQASMSSKIFDPTHNKTYTIQDHDCLKDEETSVCASNHGWLLMCKQHGYKDYESVVTRTDFFFFNPFTNEIINLPCLINSGFTSATFSSPPTDDCFILNIYRVPRHPHNAIIISTCVVVGGGGNWISTTYTNPIEFCPIRNIVSKDGIFIFSSYYGRLGMFNPSIRSWRLLWRPEMIKPSWYAGFLHGTYLVDSGGDLVLVSMGDTPKWTRVFMLDFSQMSWNRVDNLKGRTLFLGPTSSSIVVSTMADRLYNSMNDKFEFYSLKTGRNYSWLTSYGKIARHCPKRTPLCNKLWIDPPPL